MVFKIASVKITIHDGEMHKRLNNTWGIPWNHPTSLLSPISITLKSIKWKKCWPGPSFSLLRQRIVYKTFGKNEIQQAVDLRPLATMSRGFYRHPSQMVCEPWNKSWKLYSYAELRLPGFSFWTEYLRFMAFNWDTFWEKYHYAHETKVEKESCHLCPKSFWE